MAFHQTKASIRRPGSLLVFYPVVLAICVLCAAGCSDYNPAQPPPEPVEPQRPVAEPAPQQPATPKTEATEAAVGVGKKGRGYGEGVVATPIGSYFAARERIAFEIQLPQAMKMFKALEGRPPKDHGEFMEKIIRENRIQLPELPDGSYYQYDTKTELLMVIGPAKE